MMVLPQLIRIQEDIYRGKFLRFEWKIAIHSKNFTVSFLLICFTDQQGHDLQTMILIEDW